MAIAEKGALWLRITTYGKTAHGSTPENGINANEHMIAILARFLCEFKLDFEPDELLSEPTSSIDVLHGGNGTNVIPDKCTVEIDIRTLPSQNHKEIIRSMQVLIDSVKKDYPDLQADIEVINDLDSVQTPADDPFVQQLKQAIESVTGKTVIPYGSSGYTDGASFAQSRKKYPITIVGPGNPSLSHQPNEYIEIKDFFNSIAIYKKIATDFLK
ncbi:M20/M25/M40 family metallo-hydrolase [Terrilactibacillus sp. S3-3]|nr:M20/M25/M40 family metallo-hydrolase [Terrilactibacillus sp. S3-3]